MKPRRIVASAFGVLVATVALLAIFVFPAIDRRTAPPVIDSALFAATRPVTPSSSDATTATATATALYFITAEERVRGRQLQRGSLAPQSPSSRSRSFSRTHPYKRYVLHALSPAGQELTPPRQLEDIGDYETNGSVDLLGIAGNHLWTFDQLKGLQSYRLTDLTPVLSDDARKTISIPGNPLMPKDPRAYKVVGPLDALIVQATDARHYRVDPATGALTIQDDETLAALFHTRRPSDGFLYTSPARQSIDTQILSDYRIQAVTQGELWLGLITPDDRKTLTSNSAGDRYAGGKYARALVTGRFRIDDRNYRVLDLDTIQDFPDRRYLVAGFLRQPGAKHYDQNPLVLPDNSLLILHRDTLEDDSLHRLTRLKPNAPGPDGKVTVAEVYSVSLPLQELTHLHLADNTLILTGHPPRPANASTQERRRPVPEHLLSLNPETGAFTTRNISE